MILQKEEQKYCLKFISYLPNLSVKDPQSRIPLLIACEKGYTDVVTALINNNADPNVKDTQNRTPLLIACEKGNADMVKVLLEKNADPNTGVNKSRTPLMIAFQSDNVAVYNLLIQKGAKIPSISNNGNLLHYSAKLKCEGIVQEILKLNLDINQVDDQKYTPLHYAAENSTPAICKLLLDKGANSNMTNNSFLLCFMDIHHLGSLVLKTRNSLEVGVLIADLSKQLIYICKLLKTKNMVI